MADVGPGGLLRVLCGRGCGQVIEVDQQMVTNMVALGQPLVFEHPPGKCPTEVADGAAAAQPDRRFRVQIIGYEVDPAAEIDERAWYVEVPGAELLGGIGQEVSAKSFASAVNGPFTRWLAERTLAAGGNEQRYVSGWEKFQEQAAFADVPVRHAEGDTATVPTHDGGTSEVEITEVRGTAEAQVVEVRDGRTPSGLIVP